MSDQSWEVRERAVRAIWRADSGQGCHGEGVVVGLLLLLDPLMVTCNFGFIFQVAAKMDFLECPTTNNK